jgi:hypothetical protein
MVKNNLEMPSLSESDIALLIEDVACGDVE